MDLPKRKKNRLKGYDYADNGAYFVTICTKDKKKILSRIISKNIVGDGLPVPILTKYGSVVDEYINKISQKYSGINVDKYVIMPNHIHLLILIQKEYGTGNPSPTVGNIVGWLKYNVTRSINQINGTEGKNIFQRSFHDHIIRNKNDYQMIWQYIDTNPQNWEKDCFYE